MKKTLLTILAVSAIVACIFLAGCTSNGPYAIQTTTSNDDAGNTITAMTLTNSNDSKTLYTSEKDPIVGKWTHFDEKQGLKTILDLYGNGTGTVTAIYDNDAIAGTETVYWGKESDGVYYLSEEWKNELFKYKLDEGKATLTAPTGEILNRTFDSDMEGFLTE